MQRTKSFLIITAAALFSAAASLASPAKPQERTYAPEWKGAITGECYYMTSALLKGNFLPGGGEEIASIDEEGYGHIIRWNGSRMDEEWITTKPVAPKHLIKAVAADLKGDGSDITVLLLSDGTVNVWGSEAASFEMLCTDCLSDLRKQYKIFSIAAADVDDDYKKEIVALAESKKRIYILTFEWRKNKLNFFSGYPAPISTKPAEIVAAETPEGDACFLYMKGGKPKYRLVKLEFNEEGVSLGDTIVLDENKRIVSIWPGKIEQNNKNAFFILESRAGQLSLRAADTVSGDTILTIGPLSMTTRFGLSADLNYDGKTELIFNETGCKYNIFEEVKKPSKAVQKKKTHEDDDGSKTGEK